MNDVRADMLPNPGRYAMHHGLDRSEVYTRRNAQLEYQSQRSRYKDNNTAARGTDAEAEQRINHVLERMKEDWSFMVGLDCLPTHTALQFLDDSSLGLAHRHDEFHESHSHLQSALRAVVNEHYQGFNSSIGAYHQLVAGIQSSHQCIRRLRQALIDSKGLLTSTKTELSMAFNASRNYNDQLKTLSILEQVQNIPDALETCMSEKHFIPAVDLLRSGMQLLKESRFEQLAALVDMNVYMSNQEHALADLLVEELHNHMYLKSPYCESRWVAYASAYVRSSGNSGAQTNARDLHGFLDQLNASGAPLDEPSRNLETNSFLYIQTIIEAAQSLNRLENMLETVEQRLPVELFKVLEKSAFEVQQRHRSSGRHESRHISTSALPTLERRNENEVLGDLLGTVYAKLEAIAESFRVVHDVIEGICKREDVLSASRVNRAFREMWKIYQSEIRSLLHDYLSADASSARSTHSPLSEENVFRQQRDRIKRCSFVVQSLVFPQRPDSAPKQERADFKDVWERQIPGLLSLSSVHRSAGHVSPPSYNSGNAFGGHRILVTPGIFNITTLLPSSVIFLSRIEELIPPTSNIPATSLNTFLHEFLVNVFHPQLEETLSDCCSECFVQIDGFQRDLRWKQVSRKPIFRSSTNFMDVILSFCKVLSRLNHDQRFSRVVMAQINMYLDRCCVWYATLIERPRLVSKGRTTKMAAFYTSDGQLSVLISRILADRPTNKDDILLMEENDQLNNLMKEDPPDESDLLMDQKAHGNMCLLYSSMRWLANEIKCLRDVSPEDIEGEKTGSERGQSQPPSSPPLSLFQDQIQASSTHVFLPLNQETADLFDGIVGGFEKLANQILMFLHLELRCHVAYRLSSSFSGSLIYTEPADAPDEDVLSLLGELLGFYNELRLHLQEDEYSFVVRGIGRFTDSMLLRSIVRNVHSMNLNGCSHMSLNVEVLHHSLLQLEPDCRLSASKTFLNLFKHGPDAIIAAARSDPFTAFTMHEIEALLKLWYSEKIESDRIEEVVRGKKALEEKLSQLNAALVPSSLVS